MNVPFSPTSDAYFNGINNDMTEVVNLGDYLKEGEKVISRREQGQDIRQRSGIDRLINQLGELEKVTIQLPEQTRSISPAFLEEFLGESIRSYGRSRFLDRVTFTRAQRYDVTTDLEEAIDRVLTEENALSI